MIIDDFVEVTVSGGNKTHYEKIGYELPYTKDNRGRMGIKKGTKMLVKVEHLHLSSQVKVRYKCDDCGIVNSIEYSSYVYRKNSQYNKTGETLCRKCANSRMGGNKNSQYKHGCSRFCEYISNSRKRNIEFNLTSTEFKHLISQPCHYCAGYSLEWCKKSRGNGIDRKDSGIGYILYNCVPCCSKCNFIKNTLPYDKFKDYIKRIYQNMFEKETNNEI